MQIGKQSLFSEYVLLYIRNSIQSTRNLLELINTVSKWKDIKLA